MSNDVAELLQSMPELEPSADSWQRIAAQQAREASLHRARLGGGFAAAAAVVIVIIFAAQRLQQPELAVAPAIQPIMVSAPVASPETSPETGVVDARVREWQQRSQYMQQVLSGLPRRGPVARADTAGVIAELEDRIAAVDYQLNRAGLRRTGRSLQRASGFDRGAGTRDALMDEPDLWRRRAEFMDQLVRARYTEAGTSGF
ncbi:MAG: hypothetical protein QGH93_01645 [Gammaproteobacteria bacterium]|jgi:hypothetical protein|nr:hypothetical protein [Chromatiales bacterium]MDP6673542.1 hypothetical protein [Gammaproteobacteria bacterium]